MSDQNLGQEVKLNKQDGGLEAQLRTQDLAGNEHLRQSTSDLIIDPSQALPVADVNRGYTLEKANADLVQARELSKEWQEKRGMVQDNEFDPLGIHKELIREGQNLNAEVALLDAFATNAVGIQHHLQTLERRIESIIDSDDFDAAQGYFSCLIKYGELDQQSATELCVKLMAKIPENYTPTFLPLVNPDEVIMQAANAGKKVIAVGESHYDEFSQQYEMHLLDLMDQIGSQDLYLEEFDTPETQAWLNEYQERREMPAGLRRFLSEDGLRSGKGSLYNNDYRVMLVEAAFKAGIKVHFIDDRQERENNNADVHWASEIINGLEANPDKLVFFIVGKHHLKRYQDGDPRNVNVAGLIEQRHPDSVLRVNLSGTSAEVNQDEISCLAAAATHRAGKTIGIDLASIGKTDQFAGEIAYDLQITGTGDWIPRMNLYKRYDEYLSQS